MAGAETLNKSAPEKEVIGETTKQRGSLLPFRIIDPLFSLQPLIPSQDITSLTVDSFPLPQLFLTSLSWQLKGRKAQIAGQAMLIGGEIERHNGRMETPQETIARELIEECHFFIDSQSLKEPIVKRWYHFLLPDYKEPDPDKWKYTKTCFDEEIFSLEVPSFLTPYPLDPEDRTQAIVEINPEQVDEFLTEEELYYPSSDGRERIKITLIDSLSKNTERRKATNLVTDGQEDLIKDRIRQEAYRFESQIWMEVVNRLMETTSSPVAEKVRTLWQDFVQNYDPKEASFEQAQQFMSKITDFMAVFEATLPTYDLDITDVRKVLSDQEISAINQANLPLEVLERLRSRIKLYSELRFAIKSVTFEHNLQFIRNSETQTPFLMAQLILGLDRLSDHEYDLIKQIAPDVADIIDTALEVTGVTRDNNAAWYDQLIQGLKSYRNLKIRVRDGFANDEQIVEYMVKEQAFGQFYAKKFGVRPEKLAVLADYYNNMIEHLRRYLTKIAELADIKELLPDFQKVGTSATDELILRSFGLDQYSEVNDETMTVADRKAAWVKLLYERHYINVDRYREDKMQNYTFALRSVFDRIVKPANERVREVLEDIQAKQRYKLMFNITGDIKGYDITAIPGYAYLAMDNKTKEATCRKALERGLDITDIFRRQIIIDTIAFQNDVLSRYPTLAADQQTLEILSNEWVKRVAARILIEFRKTLEGNEWAYTTSRERVTGSMIGTFELAALEPTDPEYKGRTEASRPPFGFVKLVQTAKRIIDEKEQSIAEEIQIITVGEYVKKEWDDFNRYGPLRLLIGKYPFYPLIFVFFGVQPSYAKVAQRRFEQMQSP